MTERLAFRALFAVAALLFSLTAVQAANQIGKVVATAGAPAASGPGGDRPLKAGSAVFEDDKITVGTDGNAQIILNDNTKLVVGPSSTLVLDRFVMKNKTTAQNVSIKTLRGTFRFITGRSAKSAYDISSSSATIGIRGTGFDWSDRRVTGMAVMNGLVRLCDKKSKKCVNLSANCEVGQAGGNDAQEFVGSQAGGVIVGSLPYVLDQRPLQTQFHLPTNTCKAAIAKFFNQNRGQTGVREQPQYDDECGDGGCG
jgi:hypothetical protein